MTVEEFNEHKDVILAFGNGEPIERCVKPNDNWEPCKNPSWDFKFCKYRIAKKPTFCPYKNTAEFIEDNDLSYSIWIRNKASPDTIMLITMMNEENVFAGGAWYSMEELFNQFTYLEGSCMGLMYEA